jgi:hypothetical protein
MKGNRMSREYNIKTKNKIKEKFQQKRAYKLLFLTQQIKIFESDLKRLKAQLTELKELNEYE